MKKALFYIWTLATAMVACTDDYTDWAAPQATEPEAAQNVSVTVSEQPVINFAEVTTEQVSLFNATFASTEPASAPTYQVIIADKFSYDIEPDGMFDTAELEKVVVMLYGKRPVQRDISAVVSANVTIADQSITGFSAPFLIKAIPVAPIIEDSYYLIGTSNLWDSENMDLKFNHSGADVYDDPVFKLTVAAPVDEDGNRVDQWFKIAPGSCYTTEDFWDGVLGSDLGDGDNRFETGLKVSNYAFMQPASDGAKFYVITLNMMDYKMTITPLSFEEYIYVPGNHQGWSPESAPALHSPAFDGIYTGFSYLDGDFKFTKLRDWSAEYNYDSFTTYEGGVTQGGGSNLNMATAGFYMITANIPTATFTATLTEWGIVGSATAGSWDTDTVMEYNAEDESWNITTDLEDGEMKFRANNDWGINLGGDTANLSFGGDNIPVSAGNYTIKLNITRHASNAMSATITKN
ncbi:MAG: DUF5115 domain-containing protein [Phocaeicola sp.]